MFPTLIKIGSFEVTSFGLMMFLAFVVSGAVLTRNFRRRGFDDEIASNIVLACAIGGIIGAKIYYSILYKDFSMLFSRAGLVWYGGFIGGFLAGSWVIMRSRIPYLEGADATAGPLAIGYALGRIGCFLVGDDYGRPTSLPIGIAFPKGLPPTTAEELRNFGAAVDPSLPADAILRVHPTQLYEAGASIAIFIILMILGRKTQRPGLLFGLFLILAGLERLLVEFFRAKDDRFLGPFTVAQLISVILMIGGFWLTMRRVQRSESPSEMIG